MSHNHTSDLKHTDNIHIFYIGFDLDDSGVMSQLNTKENFYNELFDDITSFAFGTSNVMKRINTPQDITRVQREALAKMYQIKELRKASDYYLTTKEVEDKYLTRGEFGELILFHLLNEYYNADSLISKIYFKDSAGLPAHGFDAVHINSSSNTLWIGESKLYEKSTSAIDALMNDLEDHFNFDFFKTEFTTILHRVNDLDIELDDFTKRLINPETKILDKLANINIALFAGFTSDNFSKDYITEEEFNKRIIEEIEILQKRAQNKITKHSWNKYLNYYLFLFPLESKKQFVKDLHLKLKGAQQL